MPKVYFLILFLFFNFSGCYAQEHLTEQGNLTKKEEVGDPYAWDFGEVKQGEVLKHVFVLKNESLKTLNIKEVTTSCGCTASKIKKKTLLSQENTSLEVQFKTKGYSGPTKQYVYVRTDSLDNPVIRFIIKADVIK